MKKIILKAEDLDGYLTLKDRANIKELDDFYAEAIGSFEILSSSHNEDRLKKEKDRLIGLYDSMGQLMQKITSKEEHLHIYPFDTPVT